MYDSGEGINLSTEYLTNAWGKIGGQKKKNNYLIMQKLVFILM